MDSCCALREVHGLDLSCLVSRQSHSCVFRGSAWPPAHAPAEHADAEPDHPRLLQVWDGPVAIKALASLTTTDSPHVATSSSSSLLAPTKEDATERATVSLVHPLCYEAALAQHVQRACVTRRMGLPAYVDCALADSDASAQLEALFSRRAQDGNGSPPPSLQTEAALKHPATAAVYALLITQFVKAAPLSRLFYTFPVLPLPVVISTLCQLTHLLATLHGEAGVLYGDLKLTNVLVAEDRGRVWLVDLASSVVLHTTDDDSDREAARQCEAARHVVASTTSHVLSPELRVFQTLAGDEKVCTSSSGHTDLAASARYLPRQDLWALGVLSVELLSGQLFPSDSLLCALVASVVEARSDVEEQRDTFRQRVHELLSGPIKARYAPRVAASNLSCPSSSSSSSSPCQTYRPETELALSTSNAALWADLVAWIGHLLEPDPALRFAQPCVSCWENVRKSAFFQRLEACAPSLMAFAREAGRPVPSGDGEAVNEDDEAEAVLAGWWWSEACEEEVGDLMLGL